MTSSPDYISKKTARRNNLLVFAIYWAIVFVLYLPAAQAGRVGDFPGWVNFLNTTSFIDYINRKGTSLAGMYQFTQVLSYGFYQLFGANAWLWHLLYVSLQALNALLLFTLFRPLFQRSAVSHAATVAFAGALLFCVTPYISEVVVWEPSFHYLLGLLLMLLVLICAQQFLLTQKAVWAWRGGIIFLLSAFSLEVFYLTPFFVLTMGLYYHSISGIEKPAARKLLLYFSLPQALIFFCYFLLLYAIYHSGITHVGKVALQANAANLSKTLKYIFHIIFLGRFFPGHTRDKVYHLCSSGPVLWLFYISVALLAIAFMAYYKRLAGATRATGLLWLWVALALGLVMPLSFPESGLVILDRYAYAPCAFMFMLLVLLLHNCCHRYIFLGIVAAYALVNIRFTHKVNAYWQQSAHIVNNLVATFPNDTSKKVLLLNLPECLDGVQMVGTRDDGEFRMMYNAIMPHKITNTVYDVEAFYMSSTTDGAHIMVMNDSTIKVTLNQWGTWWLYYGFGAVSYENADFRVDMRDEGHWYNLVLKHPASEYLLLYCVGDQWRTADLAKKNVDQY